MKIVTLILPSRISKPNREFLDGVVRTTLELGHAIRTNGNGGFYSPANIEEHDLVVHYCPEDGKYKDMNNIAPPAPDEYDLAIYQKAMEVFPHMKHWPQQQQDELLRSVRSIYGMAGNSPSDKIFIFPMNSKTPVNSDQGLYYKAITLAKASGIPIKEFTSKR